MKSESPVSRHFRNNGLSTIVAITAPQHKKTFCRQTLCQVSKNMIYIMMPQTALVPDMKCCQK